MIVFHCAGIANNTSHTPSSLIISNFSFQSNFCRCNDSAISLQYPSSAGFSSCEVSHNRAIGSGGSVRSQDAHGIYFTSFLFEFNAAVDTSKGGAVYLEGNIVSARRQGNGTRKIVYTNSTFGEKKADEDGTIAL